MRIAYKPWYNTIEGVVGFIEGEGCFSPYLDKKRYQYWKFAIAVKDTPIDRYIIKEIKKVLEAEGIESRINYRVRYGSSSPEVILRVNKQLHVKKLAKLCLKVGAKVKEKRCLEIINSVQPTSKRPRKVFRKFKPTKSELYHLYWERKLSLSEIGAIYKVCRKTVSIRMKEYNIPIRKGGRSRNKLETLTSKEELEDLYWKQKLSMRQIAKILGCSVATVYRRIRQYGIDRR